MDVELFRNTKIIEKIVLVDGLPRTGKSMIGPILASLKNVEIERIEDIFENVLLLDYLGKLDRDAAVMLLKMEADNKFYQSLIGRNTNFRKTDHSSVFNNPHKFKYFKRLFEKEGQCVLKKINQNKNIFQAQTHNSLAMLDPCFDAFGKSVFLLEMVRNPIDLIYSWYKRGWGGNRYETDPLALTITVKTKSGNIAPWYDLLIEGNYNDLKPLDRIIEMIDALQEKSLDKYNEFDENKQSQIHWVIFEDFVTKPDLYLKRIETFIGTKRTRHTRKTMKKENCPREIDFDFRKTKEHIIKENTSLETFKKIDKLYDWYHTIKKIVASY